MAELKERSLEEVKALSVEETVEIMRQAGIVGAGGGGFPTYFKCVSPRFAPSVVGVLIGTSAFCSVSSPGPGALL